MVRPASMPAQQRSLTLPQSDGEDFLATPNDNFSTESYFRKVGG
jgi:hypothetical protein